ncbi:LLM class flavin-dependent oxidoreductase [Pseudomonas aeruginosa]|uniref:LLM class flavin-dependent oxidoreductase n=1 Tax=Pseudomonas aeruginosa TaxID=287 RepID=UPI00215A053A|nr:LLM class flavin-dependent oxidoreductase [Pseudomonas aeruginosa]
MSIELRGGVRASAVIGDSAFARQAARFLPDTRSRAVSAFDIQQKARLEEADGLDGALFTVSAAWPDPWLVAGWALAAAPRLRATVAHRPGSAQPTVAARALATLDGLSNGRAGVHLVIGSSDADVRRDGDFADKDERYRRAVEYLEVFTRALESREPFDYHGEFYPPAAASCRSSGRARRYPLAAPRRRHNAWRCASPTSTPATSPAPRRPRSSSAG